MHDGAKDKLIAREALMAMGKMKIKLSEKLFL